MGKRRNQCFQERFPTLPIHPSGINCVGWEEQPPPLQMQLKSEGASTCCASCPEDCLCFSCSFLVSWSTPKGLAEQKAAFLCRVQKHPVDFFIPTNSPLLLTSIYSCNAGVLWREAWERSLSLQGAVGASPHSSGNFQYTALDSLGPDG